MQSIIVATYLVDTMDEHESQAEHSSCEQLLSKRILHESQTLKLCIANEQWRVH